MLKYSHIDDTSAPLPTLRACILSWQGYRAEFRRIRHEGKGKGDNAESETSPSPDWGKKKQKNSAVVLGAAFTDPHPSWSLASSLVNKEGKEVSPGGEKSEWKSRGVWQKEGKWGMWWGFGSSEESRQARGGEKEWLDMQWQHNRISLVSQGYRWA